MGSAPFFLLSFFYKQQFVAARLAVLVFLQLQKRYRLAARFEGILALGGISLFFLFQFVIFRGQVFLLHFLDYNLLPFTTGRFG